MSEIKKLNERIDELYTKIEDLKKELTTCVGDRCTLLDKELAATKTELTKIGTGGVLDEIKKCVGDECLVLRGQIEQTKEDFIAELKKQDEQRQARLNDMARRARAEDERRALAMADEQKKQAIQARETARLAELAKKEQELILSNSPNACPKCKNLLQEGVSFCSNCGLKVTWTDE